MKKALKPCKHLEQEFTTISNCTINDNRHYGIIIDENADRSLITDNFYSGNGAGETFIAEP
ncbi:MAG: hypothetical protein GX639_14235 [Fibrobacter sp.]|nr:hypothetical protein [Fibrobacter sp.]